MVFLLSLVWDWGTVMLQLSASTALATAMLICSRHKASALTTQYYGVGYATTNLKTCTSNLEWLPAFTGETLYGRYMFHKSLLWQYRLADQKALVHWRQLFFRTAYGRMLLASC